MWIKHIRASIVDNNDIVLPGEVDNGRGAQVAHIVESLVRVVPDRVQAVLVVDPAAVAVATRTPTTIASNGSGEPTKYRHKHIGMQPGRQS